MKPLAGNLGRRETVPQVVSCAGLVVRRADDLSRPRPVSRRSVHIRPKVNTVAHPRGNVELDDHGRLGGHRRDHGDIFFVHAWLSIVCAPALAPFG